MADAVPVPGPRSRARPGRRRRDRAQARRMGAAAGRAAGGDRHRGRAAQRRAQHRPRLTPPQSPGTQARDALIAHPSVARLSFAGGAAAGQQVIDDAAAPARACPPRCSAPRPVSSSPTPTRTRPSTARCSARSRWAGSGALPPRRSSRSAPSTTPWSAASPSWRSASASAIPSTPQRRSGHCPHRSARQTQFLRAARHQGRRAPGGRRAAAGGLPEGNYLAPTVLADVTPTMAIFAEPIGSPSCALRRSTPGRGRLARQCRGAPDDDLPLDLRPGASARSRISLRVGQHVGELAQSAGSGPRNRGSACRGSRAHAIGFYTQSRTMLIAADDTPVPQCVGIQ